MDQEINSRVARLIRWQETADLPSGVSVFNPVGSEDDAGLVLDHIADLGWMVTTYTGPYPGRGIVRRCCIMRGPQDAVLDSIVDVFAETRPLAICQAFIEAMERWGDGC